MTPFVLARVNELTGGKSLETNLALIENNADVGARVARDLADRGAGSGQKTYTIGSTECEAKKRRPVVLGASIFDMFASISAPEVKFHGPTNMGTVSFGLGGVGRNLADALACFDENPAFISAVGDDDQVDVTYGCLSQTS